MIAQHCITRDVRGGPAGQEGRREDVIGAHGGTGGTGVWQQPPQALPPSAPPRRTLQAHLQAALVVHVREGLFERRVCRGQQATGIDVVCKGRAGAACMQRGGVEGAMRSRGVASPPPPLPPCPALRRREPAPLPKHPPEAPTSRADDEVCPHGSCPPSHGFGSVRLVVGAAPPPVAHLQVLQLQGDCGRFKAGPRKGVRSTKQTLQMDCQPGKSKEHSRASQSPHTPPSHHQEARPGGIGRSAGAAPPPAACAQGRHHRSLQRCGSCHHQYQRGAQAQACWGGWRGKPGPSRTSGAGALVQQRRVTPASGRAACSSSRRCGTLTCTALSPMGNLPGQLLEQPARAAACLQPGRSAGRQQRLLRSGHDAAS